MVKVYIIAQMEKVRKSAGPGLGDAAGGKGTGGTALMEFLKPVRDDTRDRAQLHYGFILAVTLSRAPDTHISQSSGCRAGVSRKLFAR